ncbi:MAG TPA: Spy/CpxP family protein refolding chaperone [Thermodesulfobacteriota bacterium]|nr:Spy/CpxP family protein refolding chaperone [Thermodesulfobacteriota bacterium]
MKRLSLSVFLLVLALSVSAFAAHHYKGKHYKWWENEEIATKVGLSEKQIADLNAIHESYAGKKAELWAEIKTIKKELYDLMGDPKATDEAITAKHNEKIAKKTEKMQLKLEMKLKMRALLSDEQIVTLSGIMKEKWEQKWDGKDCGHKECGDKECSYKDKKEDCPYKDKK